MGYRFVFDAEYTNTTNRNATKSFYVHGTNQTTVGGFEPGNLYSVRVHAVNFNKEESRSSNKISMETRKWLQA